MDKGRATAVQLASTAEVAAAYREFRQGLLVFLRGKVGDATVAEDLLQEVFIKVLEALNKGTPPIKNRAGWLHTIAKNVVIDFYRRQRLTEPLPAYLAAEESNEDQAQQALSECLLPLICQLPEIYRDTLIATDLEGKTLQSVAVERKLSLSAIKSRASRARNMLKERLLMYCQVELSAAGTVMDCYARSTSEYRKDNCCPPYST